MFERNYYVSGNDILNLNLTHGSDLDGIVCAYLFKTLYPDGVVLAFGSPTEAFNFYKENLRSSEKARVFITDLGLPVLAKEFSKKGAEEIYYFDHHEDSCQYSQKAEINGYIVDVNKSASTLFWENIGAPGNLKKLIKYVEVRDLWQLEDEDWDNALKLHLIFKKLGRKRFLDLLIEKNGIVEKIIANYEGFSSEEINLVTKGIKDLNSLKEKALQKVEVEKVRWVVLKNVPVWLNQEWLSDIANHLLKTLLVDMVAVVSPAGTAQYRVSLRSNGGVRVNKLASIFGGGGHPRAASFTYRGSVDQLKGYIKSGLSNSRLSLIDSRYIYNTEFLLKYWVENRKI
ncbi:phosphoesterase DHHA1 [Carboxydothermus islandicus]|uniref:Phosphoesterase DHHA1 n=1 Tax=Carboxydothermus islandicus TaxID=661089 RepID=A0A1L8CZY7_9THEO|nr:DHHA1 domain-containing protein [Carboxydothermus islandicus]GAV24506.1 phosphoesterase DHHA1 [Carboxydothermus islandicus]